MPYVTAALLCEKVLQEKDGTLSAVRIVDRLQYSVQGMPEGLKPMASIQGLVAIKSGPVTGEHVIKLFAERPNGDYRDIMSMPVTLLGKDQGQNFILTINVGIEQDGLYWIHILFDDEPLTQIPLMVTPLPSQTEPEKDPRPT